MKRYIKASPNYLSQLSDDELNDLYLKILDQRIYIPEGVSRREYIDEAYYEVMSEIGARKHK